ncbi:MAG: hypothetical protein QGF72_00560 [Candidatus Poseidoniaceae archaeon]|nr:hypothetical protein [Candidatus Poseidoniaceae archaeon]
MDVVRMAILLLHPILALGLLYWILKQHGWRARGRALKGEERMNARDSHELWGRRFLPVALFTVSVAFIAQVARGLIDDEGWNAYLLPSVHGIFGILGIGLLVIMTNMGKRTAKARVEGESWTDLKLRHGRAADIIIILTILHGFLGFLYIFEVL